jgi:hypothetical protein
VFALKLVNAGLVHPPLINGEFAPCAEHAVSLEFLLKTFKVELEQERAKANGTVKLATTGEVVENYIEIITKEKKCRYDVALSCAGISSRMGSYGSWDWRVIVQSVSLSVRLYYA